jgi:predicted nucleotide-binding protein (sugar kinase/HSP70/actin superfamily)
VAIDYDPGASEVNQLNRIKLMLSTAQKNLNEELAKKKTTAKHTHKKSTQTQPKTSENDMTA